MSIKRWFNQSLNKNDLFGVHIRETYQFFRNRKTKETDTMFKKLRAWLNGCTVKEVEAYESAKNSNVKKDTQTKIRNTLEFLENNKDKDCTVKILVPRQVTPIPYGDAAYFASLKMDIASRSINLVANKHLYNNSNTYIKIYEDLLTAVDKAITDSGLVIAGGEKTNTPVVTELPQQLIDAIRKITKEELKNFSDSDLGLRSRGPCFDGSAENTLVEKRQELTQVIQKIAEQEVKKLPDCDLHDHGHVCSCRVIGPGQFQPNDPDGSKAREELNKIMTTPVGTKIILPTYGEPVAKMVSQPSDPTSIIDAVGHYSETRETQQPPTGSAEAVAHQVELLQKCAPKPVLTTIRPASVWSPTATTNDLVDEEVVIDSEDNSCETLGARILKSSTTTDEEEVVIKDVCVYEK